MQWFQEEGTAGSTHFSDGKGNTGSLGSGKGNAGSLGSTDTAPGGTQTPFSTPGPGGRAGAWEAHQGGRTLCCCGSLGCVGSPSGRSWVSLEPQVCPTRLGARGSLGLSPARTGRRWEKAAPPGLVPRLLSSAAPHPSPASQTTAACGESGWSLQGSVQVRGGVLPPPCGFQAGPSPPPGSEFPP